jgi:CheY-like chemotaxis protein
MSKILLVEDDLNLGEIYKARLEAEGFQVLVAKDGEEGLMVAKANQPDLLISDVMMPRVSGMEMLEIIKSSANLKNMKVIMLTALNQNTDEERAKDLGADKYLVKSQVTLEDIVSAVHELLGDANATQPTESAATETSSATPELSPMDMYNPTPEMSAPEVVPTAPVEPMSDMTNPTPEMSAPEVVPTAPVEPMSDMTNPTPEMSAPEVVPTAPVEPMSDMTNPTPMATTINVQTPEEQPMPEMPADETEPVVDSNQNMESGNMNSLNMTAQVEPMPQATPEVSPMDMYTPTPMATTINVQTPEEQPMPEMPAVEPELSSMPSEPVVAPPMDMNPTPTPEPVQPMPSSMENPSVPMNDMSARPSPMPSYRAPSNVIINDITPPTPPAPTV